MGEAKRRGDFEKRKAEGMIKNAVEVEKYKEQIAKKQLDAKVLFDALPKEDQEKIKLVSNLLHVFQSAQERQGIHGKSLQRSINNTFNHLATLSEEQLKELENKFITKEIPQIDEGIFVETEELSQI